MQTRFPRCGSRRAEPGSADSSLLNRIERALGPAAVAVDVAGALARRVAARGADPPAVAAAERRRPDPAALAAAAAWPRRLDELDPTVRQADGHTNTDARRAEELGAERST
jgi:hypothetical protein